MALDRIGSSVRPAGAPDRQSQPAQQPGQAAPASGVELIDSDFPLAPIVPELDGPNALGTILEDGGDGRALPPGGLEALVDALADVPSASDPAAMRPNQLFMSRQLVWQPPDTAAMAASWQIMVRTYSEQRAAWLEQTNGQHIPSSLFMSDQIPAGTSDGRPGLPMVTEMEPWRFAVYAWGAERLVLKVVVKDDDEDAEPERRKRHRVALRLELTLPGLGRVVVQMEPSGGNGVIVEVGAAQNAAMQHMRDILPQLAATVGRAGLVMLRCRLRRELPPSSSEHPYPTRMQTASLTQALFRAMAEVAVLLSQPIMPDDVAFANA